MPHPTTTSAPSSGRHDSPYSLRENLQRCLWAACWLLLFRPSPRPLWRWRNWLLRCFGARVAATAHIHNTSRIAFPWRLSIGEHSSVGDGADLYNLGPLEIGEFVTISFRATLCGGTHDFRDEQMPLRRCPITVGDQAWICAEAFVGPNVVIGAGAIVGARGVVMRDVDPWTIMAGNPARPVGTRSPGAAG